MRVLDKSGPGVASKVECMRMKITPVFFFENVIGNGSSDDPFCPKFEVRYAQFGAKLSNKNNTK